MPLIAVDIVEPTIESQSIEIKPISGSFGAEIIGLDLSKPISDEDFKIVHSAHLKHHVLIFKNQNITPAQQVEFSARFGKLQYHVLKQFALATQPEVLVVSNIIENGNPIGLGDAGHFWHSDLSYIETPSLGSFLYAQILPSEGGDTLFADQHQAYEDLSQELKERLSTLRAEHSYITKYEELRAKSPWRPKLTGEQLEQVKPVAHPVVRTHPETGQKALFVSEHFTPRILGLSEVESRELLDFLFSHGTQEKYTYRHQWQAGDIVFWDNRSVIHLAAGTPDHHPRKLFRTTIDGDRPF